MNARWSSEMDEYVFATLRLLLIGLPPAAGTGHWTGTGTGTRDKGQRTKDKGQRTKDKGQRTKDKGQRTKDKGQRTKDKGQRTKDKGQRTKENGTLWEKGWVYRAYLAACFWHRAFVGCL